LVKQEALFQEILAISREQLEFCQQDNLEPENLTGLLELISQRQSIMDEIDQLHSSLMSVQPSTGLSGKAADVTNSVQHSAPNGKLIEIIEAIKTNDNACMRQLKKKSDELMTLIKQTRANRQAADAYGQGNSIYDAWFVDKKK